LPRITAIGSQHRDLVARRFERRGKVHGLRPSLLDQQDPPPPFITLTDHSRLEHDG
jgi:hypothetical protein